MGEERSEIASYFLYIYYCTDAIVLTILIITLFNSFHTEYGIRGAQRNICNACVKWTNNTKM